MRQTFLILILILISSSASAQMILLNHPPKGYVCYRTDGEMTMDGKMNEAQWDAVEWTDAFVDIEGDKKPSPYYKTNVKMLWDDNYLYIAARLEEPHLWATYTERESVIFHENDFEVFIDSKWDTHNYYEYEVNALGTEWDLMLTKPYRYGGVPINAWDIAGLKTGIHLDGTLNDPSDIDKGWTIEMAFPWKVLRESSGRHSGPISGEQWKINFSRVQWKLDIVDGKYKKTINPETGNTYPEHNWVWSPQHTIDMHKPEFWGVLQLSGVTAGKGNEAYKQSPDFETIVVLRELANRQISFKQNNNRFATSIDELDVSDIDKSLLSKMDIYFESSQNRFILSSPTHTKENSWNISEDSRMWKGARIDK